MSVLNALAGGQLRSETVSEVIKQTGLESTVSHKKLIIPGLAARLRREIEDLSGWEVLAGPVESRDISLFLKK
jgi:acetyl-CoA decarbonylase/synthase complex subunit gamma